MTFPLILLMLAGSEPLKPMSDSLPDNKAEAKEASAIAKTESAGYEFRIGTNSAAKLTMEPEPILRWTNQLRRRFYGDVYLWTRQGRPEVLASITTVYGIDRRLETEIHSLSLGRPVLAHNGKQIWEPSRPGVDLKLVPGGVPPGQSPAARLRQMRTLAKQFSASSESGDNRWELRLLPKPVYRYQSTDPQLLDGALFAFVKGTDPDAFLMIEARRADHEFRWLFAITRFNGNCTLRVRHGDREVWRVGKLTGQAIRNPKEPYFALRGERSRVSDGQR